MRDQGDVLRSGGSHRRGHSRVKQSSIPFLLLPSWFLGTLDILQPLQPLSLPPPLLDDDLLPTSGVVSLK